jgi:hypothetical protein
MDDLPRSDRLTAPPIVGRWYLVPAILWANGVWYHCDDEDEFLRVMQSSQGAKWWPVWGNKHEDAEHLLFPYPHYHIDQRFLTKRHWAEHTSVMSSRSPMQNVQSMPLHYSHLKSGPPKPKLRRMRCTLAHVNWEFSDATPILKMNDAFSGQQCAKGALGWICPHKQFALGSVEVIDGVVTCPLHGLRIDAESGKCIGSKDTP